MSADEQDDALCAAANKAFAAPFGAVLLLTPGEGAPVWIDGNADKPAASLTPPGPAPACVWRGARDALIRALSNTRAFENAYVSGRVSVAGDMSVMARLTIDDAR